MIARGRLGSLVWGAMGKQLLRGIGLGLVVVAIAAAYVGLARLGATVFELVVATFMAAMVVVVAALVLQLRALHRALYQQAQVAYQGFVLDFFLAVGQLLRERRAGEPSSESDLLWSLIEDYFHREAQLYHTVVEELYDKTSMMHMLERGRLRREPGLGDPRPVEPLYRELHELLGRLRDQRQARQETAGRPRATATRPTA